MRKYFLFLISALLIGTNVSLAAGDEKEIDPFGEKDIVEIKGMVKEWTDAIVALAPCDKKASEKLDWKERQKFFEVDMDLHSYIYDHFLGEGSKASMFFIGYGNKYYKGKKHKAPMVTATMIKKSTNERKTVKKSTIDFWKYVSNNTFNVVDIDVTNVQAYLSVIIGKGTYDCYNLVLTLLSNNLTVKDGEYKLEDQVEETMVVEHRDSWYNAQKRGLILGDISLTIYYE